VEDLIQADLAVILKALTLTGIAVADIGKIREMPKAAETLDVVPCVLICPRASPAPQGLSFEGSAGIAYVEEIIVVAGREGDFSTDQAPTQTWYRQCYNAVERNADGSWRVMMMTVPSVYDIRVSDTLAGFERSKLKENYAYLSFFVTVRSSE